MLHDFASKKLGKGVIPIRVITVLISHISVFRKKIEFTVIKIKNFMFNKDIFVFITKTERI